MLLTSLHKKRSSRCLPSADHGDGALSSFHAASLKRHLRTRAPRYLGTFLRVGLPLRPAKKSQGAFVGCLPYYAVCHTAKWLKSSIAKFVNKGP
jgi:hypothetical protein